MIDPASPDASPLPLDRSIGYQVRMTHRLIQRALQARIEGHGVTLGMWYFLRILWDQDGLTQSELSRRVGTMEPTTLSAVASMEKAGLVCRTRHSGDRRKMHVNLTEKGRALQAMLLPMAAEVLGSAARGLTDREVDLLLKLLYAMQDNLKSDLAID
jgi:DNA-binding MarR family transcriptional regulator